MARSCSCNDFNRAAAAAPRRRRRGEGAAERSSRGCRCRPAPASTGARSCCARPARRCRCTAPRCSRPRHFEEGIAQAAAAAGPEPAGARLDLHGRRLGRAVGARARQGSQVPRTAPDARRSHEGAGKPFTEDENLMWHPSAAGLAELHDEGKVTVFPAIGYEPQDESHFTSRHYWEVGELDTNTRTGWMGRYLDIVGEPDQPAAGPVAGLLARAGAGHRDDARRRGLLARRLHDVGRRPGRTCDRTDARNLRRAGCALSALARVRPGARRLLRHDLVLNKMAGFVESEEEIGRHLAGHLSRQATSPNGSPCSRRCSTRACRSNAPR